MESVNLQCYFDLVRADGSRVTVALREVLTHLYDSGKAHSISELHSCLTNHGKKIGLPTLYRLMDKLSELELIHPVILKGKEIRYFLCKGQNDNEHHHFICTNCHCVAEVAISVEKIFSHYIEEQLQSTLTDHSVLLEGLCSSCKKG